MSIEGSSKSPDGVWIRDVFSNYCCGIHAQLGGQGGGLVVFWGGYLHSRRFHKAVVLREQSLAFI